MLNHQKVELFYGMKFDRLTNYHMPVSNPPPPPIKLLNSIAFPFYYYKTILDDTCVYTRLPNVSMSVCKYDFMNPAKLAQKINYCFLAVLNVI